MEITPETAEAFIASLSEPDGTGKMVTPKTVRHMRGVVGLFFGKALPHGVENPFKNIQINHFGRNCLRCHRIGKGLALNPDCCRRVA